MARCLHGPQRVTLRTTTGLLCHQLLQLARAALPQTI
jgi:hypothetical protein